MGHVELFNACQETLDRRAALINTLALITGSYFVVRAVAAMRIGNQGGACAGCWRPWAWAWSFWW